MFSAEQNGGKLCVLVHFRRYFDLKMANRDTTNINSNAIANSDSSTNEEYFRSYANLSVHELMIKDKPRTLAYKEFIEKNAILFRDKVVLDVGAGTGILSLFAARCGARKVYAVEASDIACLCKEIVKVNKYEDVVTVIQGQIEKTNLPEKVDIIVSEWMGFYLLHESMLESVLYARDKWLKDDGMILPSHAGIYACPVSMTDYCLDNIDCWENVYEFDFTPLMQQKVAAHLQQPTVVHLKQNQLLSDSVLVARFDLKKMTLSDIEEIEEQMSFEVNKDSDLHGFAVWFDVRFTPDLTEEQYGLTCLEKAKLEDSQDKLNEGSTDKNENSENSCTNLKDTLDKSRPNVSKDGSANKTQGAYKNVQHGENSSLHHVTLDTSPFALETHWKQTVCFLPVCLTVRKGVNLYCKLTLCQDTSNRRNYNISLELLEGLELSDSELEDDDTDGEDHPVPCECGAGRCTLIRAIMERYDAEQTELEMEAEFTDVSAEVQAAQTLDNDTSCLDTDSSLKDESCPNNDSTNDSQ